jgi:glycosyltransferase involved in cell wall biosynthesis
VSDHVRVSAADPGQALITALATGRPTLVADPGLEISAELIERLVAESSRAGVASASPVPIDGARRPVGYETSPASPPSPSLPQPCPRLCVINPSAASSLGVTTGAGGRTASDEVAAIGIRLLQHGWRHVAAPGVALAWDPSSIDGRSATAGWTPAAAASLSGGANPGLEAHVSWGSAQIGPVRLVVDGACMTTQPYTGTQHLVLEISRWLAATRPGAAVTLAVPSEAVAPVTAALSGAGVGVVERGAHLDADVVYRPYQMLFAGELDFVASTGRRSLVGQLDMIGFSNPFYHPSDQLFFFARNLQRHLMRTSDGVTFISQFGLESAYVECPDLERARLHVVNCGADPSPREGALDARRPLDDATSFIVALASTFWHKNRAHVITTFAAAVREYGYDGHLVIAGPEPYYGRSSADEDGLIATLPDSVAARIHRWGHISDDEKWWLLRHAQVVLYPSIIEGFGLVPFEAAAVGTPCLVSNSAAPGELLGATPAAITSWDPSDWASAVAEIAGDSARAADVVRSTLAAGQTLTWEGSARLTWEAIDAALAAPRRWRHTEDGSNLTRVAASAEGRSTALKLRFDFARLIPGARRRLRTRSRSSSAGDKTAEP